MYSLYRAWLNYSGNTYQPPSLLPPPPPPSPLPPAITTTTTTTTNQEEQLPTLQGPPDIHLQVGPNLTQFSAHRNILIMHSGYFKAALTNYQGLTSISVPNTINIDEFSSLLTFMYTGYLDLNITNIYNIILATHILHMPRALELCRNFLIQQTTTIQQQQQQQIIKPIPILNQSTITTTLQPPIKTILNLRHKTNNNQSFKLINKTTKPDIQTTTTTTTTIEQQQQQPSTSSNDFIQENKKKKRKKSNNNNNNNNNNIVKNQEIIIDIACCDGPVKFQRVINKNYGNCLNNTSNNNNNQIKTKNEELLLLNKIMNENIRNDENNKKLNLKLQNDELFKCIYCNHTFKSQYCYQKHARRHLNPISLKILKTKQQQETTVNNDDQQQQEKTETTTKRNLKLLDMNVQYYPCKTCGSKFPSYYFVHKHRKLCHPDEMADNNNKNNEIIPEIINNNNNNNNNNDNEDNNTSSSNNSNIDVVEISNNSN